MKMKTAIPAMIAIVAIVAVGVIALRPEAVDGPVRAVLGIATGTGSAVREGQPNEPPGGPASEDPRPVAPVATLAPGAGVRLHGVAAAIAKPAGALRLATYNIENLFDPLKEGEHPGMARDDASEGDPHPVKPVEHRRAVAAAIHAINADVLAVQEISSLEALTKFRDEYLSDLGYTYVASIDAGDRRGIEQSVLSRFPIKESINWPGMVLGGTHPEKWGRQNNEWAGQPIKFARSPLKVVVEVPATADKAARIIPLTLFVIHHKSGGPGGYWREAEAARTAELAKAAAGEGWAADAAVVVLGDFNAKTGEAPLQAYLAAGFTSAMGDRPDTDPTWITHSSGRVIDHLFLSPWLAKRLVPDTRFVLGTITRPEGVDWRTTPAPPGWASDHYPVVIDFKFE